VRDGRTCGSEVRDGRWNKVQRKVGEAEAEVDQRLLNLVELDQDLNLPRAGAPQSGGAPATGGAGMVVTV
jgi:hypothetical protein